MRSVKISRVKNFLIIFLLLILACEGVTLSILGKDSDRKETLSATSEFETASPVPSVNPTPSPSPTPTTTTSPTPKPLPAKTPTTAPQPKYSSEEINGFIERFASQYGVSSDVLRYIALCESGFNPSSSHLGYAGLFQFGATTWKNLRQEFGEDVNPDLRFNAEEAIQTAAYAISVGKRGIWPNCYP